MRIGLLCAAVSLCALVGTPAAAQVQERTLRWGHLNNTDHPVSFGVQKFAEVLAAKSGGKLRRTEKFMERWKLSRARCTWRTILLASQP